MNHIFLSLVSRHQIEMLACRVSGPEPKPEFKGDTRTYRVQLDCNQYQKDMMDIVKGHEVGTYSTALLECNGFVILVGDNAVFVDTVVWKLQNAQS